MPRQRRIQYEGAIYHLTSRGDRREEIFWDDLDRKSFLQTLGAACQKTGRQVHAYCLMSNHFHLVVETPRANLVEGMKWLLGTYTMRFNRRHKLSGHLFAGRYKSLLVDGATPWLFAHGMRLRAFESGAGQVAGKAGAIAKLPLEQLSKLLASQTETGALGAL
jgi:REP element-mobilizing transposase RayT